jgi:hypothetical protein
MGLAQTVGQQLLNVKFDDPAVDERMIRYHASLSGKMEIIKQLIDDNYPDPQQVNDFSSDEPN